VDEQMNTIVVAVTQAVTEAVMDAATEYADGAVDRMMAEVQDQIDLITGAAQMLEHQGINGSGSWCCAYGC
jgi:hypothetical protein